MATSKVTWIIINCNNKKEADVIGKQLLKQRLIGCFDIIPEREAAYFWPPKSGKIEKIKGSMLIGVTVQKKYNAIVKVVRKLHSDQIPFIGSLLFNTVNKDYYKWLKGELL
jgi:periplasmic divalent cation tolerance protein